MPINFHLGVEGYLSTILYIGMFVSFVASVFWRPDFGLYILAFALPMQTGRYKIHDYFLGPQFIDILLLGVILGLIVKGQSVIPKSPLARFLLLLAGFYYFSLWEGSYFISAPLPIWITDVRFSDWKNYVEMFLLALVVGSAIREKRQVVGLIVVMCLAVFVVNRNYMSMMSGRDLSHFSYEVRDAGLLGYAGVNGLAAFEAMFVSFLLGINACIKNWLARIGILLLLTMCAYCLLYSFSRGGYAGALIGLMSVGLLKSRKLLAIVALILIAWQTLLPVSVQERILMTTGDRAEGAEFDPSAQERVTLWEDAVQLFEQNPVTGTGFETYQFMGRVGPYRDTHNYYIKILAESGMVGLTLFAILLWKLFKSGLDLFRRAEDSFWSAVGLGFVALMASAIITNFFGDRWTYQQVDGYLWMSLGCVIRGLIVVEETKVQPETVPIEAEAVAV